MRKSEMRDNFLKQFSELIMSGFYRKERIETEFSYLFLKPLGQVQSLS